MKSDIITHRYLHKTICLDQKEFSEYIDTGMHFCLENYALILLDSFIFI